MPPPVPGLESAFHLDGLKIDSVAGDVSGPGGVEYLDPKVMGLLVPLAQRVGLVVPREDLMARLWPGVVVTDDALSRCVYELRRQVSQAAGDERFKSLIETLPKRGYRLHGRISSLPLADNERPRRSGVGPRIAIAASSLALFVVLVGLVRLADRKFKSALQRSPVRVLGLMVSPIRP